MVIKTLTPVAPALLARKLQSYSPLPKFSRRRRNIIHLIACFRDDVRWVHCEDCRNLDFNYWQVSPTKELERGWAAGAVRIESSNNPYGTPVLKIIILDERGTLENREGCRVLSPLWFGR